MEGDSFTMNNEFIQKYNEDIDKYNKELKQFNPDINIRILDFIKHYHQKLNKR